MKLIKFLTLFFLALLAIGHFVKNPLLAIGLAIVLLIFSAYWVWKNFD